MNKKEYLEAVRELKAEEEAKREEDFDRFIFITQYVVTGLLYYTWYYLWESPILHSDVFVLSLGLWTGMIIYETIALFNKKKEAKNDRER